jgi:hypothetical protein
VIVEARVAEDPLAWRALVEAIAPERAVCSATGSR